MQVFGSAAVREKLIHQKSKKLLRSHLNRGNVIVGMNVLAVGIVKYGAGVLDWTKEELKSIDIKTRKLMTLNGNLNPRGNVGRLYLARKEEGKGLVSCKECVNMEVQSLDKYQCESEK